MIPGLDIILGGVTGLIGNAFTTWFKYKNAKMEYEHEEKMVDLQTKAMIQKSQMQMQIIETQVEGEIRKEEEQSFQDSQKYGSQKLFHEKWIDMIMAAGSGKWTGWIFRLFGTIISAAFAFVDWLNAAMRPTLTLYLVGSSSYITYLAWRIMQDAGIATMTATQAVGIFQQVTSTMIYLAVSAVTWWFGDRTMSKYLQQQGAKQRKHIATTPSGTTVKPTQTPGKKPGGGGDVGI